MSSYNYKGVPHHKLKFEHFIPTEISEPSDVVYDQETNHMFVVSDHTGTLYECEISGKVIRKAPEKGLDFEGVEIKDNNVFVADESGRKVYKYNKKDLSLVYTYNTPYDGPRNSGFESLTYNETKKCFIMISEKNPIVIFEMDENFKVLKQYPFSGVRDISAARWYKGQMYLLSDMDMSIMRCDPNTYEVKEEYSINVLNPEGLAFDKNSNIIITSDKLSRIYYFKNLPTNNE